ncbi:hypothetical protein F511_06985 [Dorcoceras hygrometricum]|uniref:Uncharacterized protein n=1 Tax=Dorcoceras hygrometricum TaxID=472368 RepID=A0A2Z7D865_9LAMI|nr:hypothetical protein F511_06985 [Dorcoceras hygrometricum]
MNQMLHEDKDETDVALRKRCISCWCSSVVENETAVCSAVEDETAVGVFQSLKQSVVAKHSAVGSNVKEDTQLLHKYRRRQTPAKERTQGQHCRYFTEHLLTGRKLCPTGRNLNSRYKYKKHCWRCKDCGLMLCEELKRSEKETHSAQIEREEK